MKGDKTNVEWIQSCDNLVDLLKKTILSTTLKKLRYNIRMWKLGDLQIEALKKVWLCPHH